MIPARFATLAPTSVVATAPATVIEGDAGSIATALAQSGRRARLAYLDPPFASHADYRLTAGAGRDRGEVAFTDRWDSLDAYVAAMAETFASVREFLTDDGSIIVHCDHHASPYLAVALDRIFGIGDRGPTSSAPGFRNELVWRYGLGGSSPRCYPKKHDTLLWYTRGREWHFEAPRVPATSARMRGQTKKAPDVLDVPTLNNMARERVGYPTQKPLQLLDLLVRAHTEPGDLVADLFCGSGAAAVAAVRADRAAVAVDIGRDALVTTTARLAALGGGVEILAKEPGAAAVDGPVDFAATGARRPDGTLALDAVWCARVDCGASMPTTRVAWCRTARGDEWVAA